jgi:hypothetical protein
VVRDPPEDGAEKVDGVDVVESVGVEHPANSILFLFDFPPKMCLDNHEGDTAVAT